MTKSSNNNLKQMLLKTASTKKATAKRHAPTVFQYSKNLVTSMGSYSADYFIKSMSSVKEFGDLNKNFAKEIATVVKNPKGAMKNQVNRVMTEEVKTKLGAYSKFALEDIKSGKIYDRNRYRTSEDGNDSFGGFDLDDWDMDDLGDDGFEMSDDTEALIESDVEIARAQEDSANNRAKMTVQAMGEATGVIVDTQRNLSHHQLKVGMVQHGQLMDGFKTMVDVNVSMIEAQSAHFTQLNQALAESTNHISSKLDELIDVVRQGPTGKRDEDEKYESKSIFRGNSLDAKKYFKHIIGKNMQSSGGSMLSGMLGMVSPDQLLDLYMSNPIEFIANAAITKVLPKYLKSTMERVNESFSNVLQNFLLKLTTDGKNKTGLKGAIGRIFGYEVEETASIDPTAFKTGKYAPKTFTENLLVRMDKYISEVIPMYLRTIASALTGKSQKILDYKTGRYVDPKAEVYRISNNLNDMTGDMSTTTSQVRNALGKTQMTSGNRKNIEEDTKRLLQHYAENNLLLNPYEKMPEELSGLIDKSSWNFIMGSLKAMPRNKMQKASAEVLRAREKMNQRKSGISKELADSGLLSLFSEYSDEYDDIASSAAAGGTYKKTKFDYATANFADLRGVNATNKLLYDIRSLLTKGIIVFPWGSSKNGHNDKNNDMRSDALKRIKDYDEDENKRLYSDYQASRDRELVGDKDGYEFSKDIDQDAFAEYLVKMSKTNVSDSGLNKKGQKRVGYGARLKDLPFKYMNAGLNFLDKAMFKMVYGHDPTDENNSDKSLLETFLGLIEGTSKKITDHISNKLFGEDGSFTKGKNKILDKYVRPYIKKGKDFLVGDEGIFTPMIGKVKGELKSMTGISSGKEIKASYDKGKLASVAGIDDTSGLNMVEKAGYYLNNGIHSITSTLSSVFLGDDFKNEKGEMEQTRSKKLWADVSGEFKGFMPKGIAGGLLGATAYAGSGLLTGLFLPGGPILAGLIGSSASFISHSEKFREYVFGTSSTTDENGNVVEGKKGLINREIVDGFKKFAPGVTFGAVTGAMMSNFGIMGMGFLPGGPIMGGLLGSITGMTLASDQMRELLFGKKDDETGNDGLFSRNTRKKMVEALGIGTGGAAAGWIAGTAANNIGIFGLSMLPGGPIMGAIGGITAALNADRIKRYFFGDEADELDDDGKKTGKKKNDRTGLFAKVFDTVKDKMLKPLTDDINKKGDSIKNWFQTNIVNSFKESLKGLQDETGETKSNIKTAFSNIGTNITTALNEVFKESFGNDLKTLFQEKVLKPLTSTVNKIVNAFGRFLGNVLAFPFKALNAGVKNRTLRNDKDAQKEETRQRRIAQWERTKNAAIAWGGKMHAALGEMGIGFNTSAPNSGGLSDIDAMEQQVISVDENGNALPKKSWFSKLKDRYGSAKDALTEKAYRAKATVDLAISSADTALSERQATRKIARDEKDKQTLANMTAREETRVKNRREKKERKDKLQAVRDENDDLKESNSKLKSENKNDNKAGQTKSDFIYTKSFKNNIVGMHRTMKDIRDEIKGQLNGVGWNVEYIRNILMSKFGGDGANIPEPTGEKLDVSRPRGAFRKFTGWVKKIGRGIGDGISDKVHGAGEFIRGIPFLAPLFGLGRGVKALAKGAWGLGGDLKDGVFGLGSIIKEGLILGFKGLGETVTIVGTAIKASIVDVAAGIGAAFKETAEGLGGLFKELTIGLGAIFAGGGKSLGMLLPELMGLGIGTVKVGGKLIGKGLSLVASPLYAKLKGWLKSSDEENGWLSGKTHVTGTIDVGSLALGPSPADKVLPVHLLNGTMVSTPPLTAIPVYIAGGRFKGTDIDNDIDITNINGALVPGKQNMSPEELKARYGMIGYSYEMFRRKFRKNNDYNKTLNTMIGDVSNPEEAAASQQVMQAEILSAVKEMSGGTGGGPEKKENVGGIAGLLRGLSFLLPLLGSVLMGLGGQTDRAVINAMKFAKKIFPKGMEGAWNFVKKKTGAVASSASGLAKKGISRLVNGKLIGEVSQEASEELIKRLAIKGGAELSDDAVKYGGKKLSSILAETGSRKGMKVATKFTANLAKESAKTGGKSAVLVAQNAAKNMTGNGVIKKIVDGIRKLVTNSKVLQILGGSNMIAGIDKFFVKLSSHLATKTLTSSIIAKIFAKMSLSAAFIVYDVSTGMAEAANILQVRSEDVTPKMRVASGLAKMISGILMIVPDSLLGPMIYNAISNEKQEAEYKTQQEALYSDYEKYADQGGDKPFDEWNEKVANKRVWRKVADGVGGAFKGVKNFFTGKKNKDSTFTQSNIGNVSSLNLEQSTTANSANTNSIAILLKGILDVITGGKVDTNSINKANSLITGSGGTSIGNLGTAASSTSGIFSSAKPYGSGGMPLLNTTQFDPANINNIPSNQGSIKDVIAQSYGSNPVSTPKSGFVLNTSIGNIQRSLGSSKYKKNERIDRVMQYYQYDPRWAEQGLSPQQASTACGPIVAAMILSSYLGKQINPAEMHSLAKVNGFQNSQGATNINFFDFLGTKYNVKFSFGMPNKATWIKQLKENKPMIIMGKGTGNNAKTPFNETMHFMIVSSYSNNDDKFFVIDPFTFASGYYKFEDFASNIKGMRYTSDRYGAGIAEASVQKAVDTVYSDKHALNTSAYETGVESEGLAPGEPMDFYGLIDAFGDVLSSSVSKFFGFDVANYESSAAVTDAAGAAAMAKYPMSSSASMYAGKWLTGDTDIRSSLGVRLDDLAKANNKKIGINSGRRTYAEQLAIYNKKKAENPGLPDSQLQYLAAIPGRSKHELGLAADVSGWAQNLTNEQLAPYGLYKPLSNEPWHVEPLDLKGMSFDSVANKYGRLPESYSANANDNNGNYASGMAGPTARTKAVIKGASGVSQLAEQSRKVQSVIASVSAKSNDPILKLLVDLTEKQVKLLEVIADNTGNAKVVTTGGNSNKSESTPVIRSVKQDFAKVISK